MKLIFRKLLSALLVCALLIGGGAMALAENIAPAQNAIPAEYADSDWYMEILNDAELMAQYPHYAFVDVNENGVPALFITTTGDPFITDADSGLLFGCADGKPIQLMAFGGQAGESFYSNEVIHTLTYFNRSAGEMHIQVFTLGDGVLIPVTTADTYSPGHAPEGNNAETVYLQDGNPISEEKSDTLWQTYANDLNIVSFDQQVVAVRAESAGTDQPTYRALSIGSRGSDVRALQGRLNSLGYNCGRADGVFGSSTKMAVIEFQEVAGLRRQDGVATAEVQSRLFAANAPAYVASAPSEVESAAPSMSIKAIQQRLRDLGYTDAPVNGRNDARFKSALKAFQSRAGLRADGIPGAKTIRALQAGRAPYNNDYIALQRGDTGSHVAQLQRKLLDLGFFTSSVDGKYGSRTVMAIEAYKSFFYIGGNGEYVSAELVRRIMNTDPLEYNNPIDDEDIDTVEDEEILPDDYENADTEIEDTEDQDTVEDSYDYDTSDDDEIVSDSSDDDYVEDTIDDTVDDSFEDDVIDDD